MEDSAENLAKANIGNIPCFPLICVASHFIVEGYQVGKV